MSDGHVEKRSIVCVAEKMPFNVKQSCLEKHLGRAGAKTLIKVEIALN